MHTFLACLSVALVAVVVALSILWRRQRADRRRADERAKVDDARHSAITSRLSDLTVIARCRRIHAADLPPAMVRAPVWVDVPEPEQDEVDGPSTKRSPR